jgi:hypothetical protein
MAILKSNITRKMFEMFMEGGAPVDVLKSAAVGPSVGETIRRLDAGMAENGKKSFTIADIRRISNEIYTETRGD